MKKICHVVKDVDTDYKLEQFLAENNFILETEGVPDAAFELLNFAEIGREHQEPEGGMLTSFGYVEQHSDLVEAYKTLDLTAKMPDYTIILELPFTFPLDCEEDVGPHPPVRLGPSNHLAQRLTDMEPKAMTAYKALLEATDCKDLQDQNAHGLAGRIYLLPAVQIPRRISEGGSVCCPLRRGCGDSPPALEPIPIRAGSDPQMRRRADLLQSDQA